MTEEGHSQALEELRSARAQLSRSEHIRAYAELSFGIAFHLLSIGAQRRFSVYRDNHEGLGRWLRERGQGDAAQILAQLESLRTGRWYGRKGNGATAETLDEFLARLEAWALAETSP